MFYFIINSLISVKLQIKPFSWYLATMKSFIPLIVLIIVKPISYLNGFIKIQKIPFLNPKNNHSYSKTKLKLFFKFPLDVAKHSKC